MDEGIRTIRRRELFEQQSGIKGLAVQGAETAHDPDDIFSGKCMGGRARVWLARQALGNQFQEPARHQTSASQEPANEFLLGRKCLVAGVTGGSAQTAPEIEPACNWHANPYWQSRVVQFW